MQFIQTISTIDSHTAGEGTRLVTDGLPPIPGASMIEKMCYAQAHLDWAPQFLLLEPRGHRDLYGAVLQPSCDPQAQIGVLFMNNHGFEPMCGHAVIGVVTSLVETHLLSPQEGGMITLDTPAGLIRAYVEMENGRVKEVTFENVPAYVVELDVPMEIGTDDKILVDIAFGGNFFGLVDAEQLGLKLSPENTIQLAELGMKVLKEINEQMKVRHPLLPDIDRVTDLRFIWPAHRQGMPDKNVVVLGEYMLDRSPCGTGTCAELAVRFARGLFQLGEPFITESIIGLSFTGRVVRETRIVSKDVSIPAIVPEITGSAYITGFHQFVLQEDDPLPKGFMLV